MGIIEGRRLINQNPHIDEEIHTLLCDFVKMQEESANPCVTGSIIVKTNLS